MSGILMKFSTSEVTKFLKFKKKVERERKIITSPTDGKKSQ